ncbi:uncharacterized protein LOC142226429 [Haematobia irritans]|uniref:uncharacterized protein LOC142226429 n=1 Tax=Haematobia irritans TaxID=7368 RepID=UPI003F4F7123
MKYCHKMINKQFLIIAYFVINIVIQHNSVEGIQCYVCEDCNEYQDFRELSICGVTQKPSTLPEILPSQSVIATSASPQPQDPGNNQTTAANSIPSAKPPEDDYNEDYLYDYSAEAKDESGSSKAQASNDKSRSPTTAPLTTQRTTISSPAKEKTKTTQSSSSAASTSGINSSSSVMSTESTNSTTSSVSSSSAKPPPPPEDYDYMEYEDRRSFDIESANLQKVRSSTLAASKMDEHVCYMYRYYANNTVFTNRGCTTLLNSNKFLTCQTLSNAHTMVGCRICSEDGCNKYDLDESGEDHLISGSEINGISNILFGILAILFIAYI